MELGRRAGLCICFDLEQHKAASGGSDQNQRETMQKSCDVTGHGIWLQVKVTQTSQGWGAPAGTQVAQPPSSSPLQVLIWVQVLQSDIGTESRGEQQDVSGLNKTWPSPSDSRKAWGGCGFPPLCSAQASHSPHPYQMHPSCIVILRFYHQGSLTLLLFFSPLTHILKDFIDQSAFAHISPIFPYFGNQMLYNGQWRFLICLR